MLNDHSLLAGFCGLSYLLLRRYRTHRGVIAVKREAPISAWILSRPLIGVVEPSLTFFDQRAGDRLRIGTPPGISNRKKASLPCDVPPAHFPRATVVS